MSLKKVKATVEFKVPAWENCNHQGNIFGQPSKEMCRFCVKEKGYYRCALYNEILNTTQGTLVTKTRACQKNTAGFESNIEEPSVAAPDVKTVIKAAITEYNKVYKQLLGQGYPEALASKLAQEYLTGGK